MQLSAILTTTIYYSNINKSKPAVPFLDAKI